MSKNIRVFAALVLILILGFYPRIVDLVINPPELFLDELINYVSAKSIIQTGSDLYGNLGVYFTDLTVEYRPPIYGYTSYLYSLVLGENEMAIRFPAVVYGLITIVLVFLLANEFFRNKKTALMAAFFLAIIPWHIHFSRLGWEPASMLPFLLLSVYVFLQGVNRDKKYLVAASFALFTITIYTYHAAPLYSFIFLLTLFLLHYRYFLDNKRLFVICVLIAAILVIPYIWTALTEYKMLDRAKYMNTFKDGINSESLQIFVHNYFSHLSLDYLFIKGSYNFRYSYYAGNIYWVMLPFILVGIWGLIRSDIPLRYRIFLAVWLIGFPLGGSLTNDSIPHPPRTLPGAPILCIMSAFGLAIVLKFIEDRTRRPLIAKALLAIVLILSLISLQNFTKYKLVQYSRKSHGYWDYGNREILAVIKPIQHRFERACLQSLSFTNKLPVVSYFMPETNLEIINDMEDERCLQKGTILVQKVGKIRIQRQFPVIAEIRAPNGNILYYVQVVQ